MPICTPVFFHRGICRTHTWAMVQQSIINSWGNIQFFDSQNRRHSSVTFTTKWPSGIFKWDLYKDRIFTALTARMIRVYLRGNLMLSAALLSVRRCVVWSPHTLCSKRFTLDAQMVVLAVNPCVGENKFIKKGRVGKKFSWVEDCKLFLFFSALALCVGKK